MLAIQTPIAQFFDLDGSPLDSGSLYFGAASQNPETDPITVYWDAAGTQPAAQPVRTLNGYPVRNGSPAPVYTAGDYSLTVRNRRRELVIYTASAAANDLALQAAIDQLRADLADDADQLMGAGLVGFDSALSYAAGTVGDSLAALDAWRLRQYEFVGSGEAGNDTAALAAFYASLPVGAMLVIRGKTRVTSTLTLNRRIHVVTPGQNDCIIVSVGAGNDGVVFDQGTANDELGTATQGGLNGLKVSLNVYGTATSCRNAVVLRRVDRSQIFLNVRAGAAQYGTVIEGCLINRIHIESTVNYAPPIAAVGTQLDHVLIKKNTTYNVATNINEFWLNLEGARHGFVAEAQPGEGGNTVRGVIEGLTGKAFIVAECEGLHISDFWAEANEGDSTFDLCRNLRIGPGVNCYDGLGRVDDWSFTNQRGLKIDGYYGGFNIASSCTGTQLGQIGTPDYRRNLCADVSVEHRGWMADASYPSTQLGHHGGSPMENVFPNPYMDLWANAGTSAPPIGTTAPTGASVSRATSPVYPSNGVVFSCSVVTSGTGINHGLFLRPGFGNAAEGGCLSVMIPVYVPAGQPGVRVWIFDGTQYNLIHEDTTTKNAWIVARGTAKMIAGNDVAVVVSAWDGSSYPTGVQLYVGGCSIVNGPTPPKHLADHGKRLQFICNSITYTPDFVGQRAVVGTDGYMAISNGVPADWKKITP